MNDQDEHGRRIALILELEVAIQLLEDGLAELQRTTFARVRHFTFLLLLANGLERLMKVIIIVQTIKAEGRFLTEGELKVLGHNLEGLLQQILTRCFTPEYLRGSIGAADSEFLRTNQTFTAVLSILSDFARGDRYMFLDQTATPTETLDSPESRWEALVMNLCSPADLERLRSAAGARAVVAQTTQVLVITVERSLRSLCRLFTLADLGEDARPLSVLVRPFGRLEDGQLGKIVYKRVETVA